MKNKQLILPKLQENQSMDLIRQMQENRSLCLDEKEKLKERDDNKLMPNNSKGQYREEYSVREVIKEARNEKMNSFPVKEEKKVRKIQLEPIRKD